MAKVASRKRSAKKPTARRRTVQLDVATARRFEFLLACLLDDEKWNEEGNFTEETIGRLHRRMVRLLREEEIQLAVAAAVSAVAPANDNGEPHQAAPTSSVPTLALEPFNPAREEELERARRWVVEIAALADLVKRKSAVVLIEAEAWRRTPGRALPLDELGHVHWEILAIAAGFFDSNETGNIERHKALKEAGLLDEDEDDGPVPAAAGARR